MGRTIREVVRESAVIKENAPDFCRHPEILENLEVNYERECKLDKDGNKTSCQVVSTLVTIGKGTPFEKTYKFDRPISSNEAKSIFAQKCDCGCSREYKINF